MTTIELLVAMGIFTTVVAISMAAVVAMTHSTSRSTTAANAVDSSRLVFERLDRQVRYAESVNAPGTGASGAQYVEFRIPAVVAPDGVPHCYQWRYDPGTATIGVRQWIDQTGVAPGSFATVATQVLPGVSTPYPFSFAPAAGTQDHQTVTLHLKIGSSAQKVAVDTTSTFVARNSSTGSQSNQLSGGQSIAPVCLSVATRA